MIAGFTRKKKPSHFAGGRSQHNGELKNFRIRKFADFWEEEPALASWGGNSEMTYYIE